MEKQEVFIQRVIDGDTLLGCLMPEGTHKIKVRILGIDCPESAHNKKCEREGKRSGGSACQLQIPLGKKAKRRAHELLFHKTIYLESEYKDGVFQRDDFKRTLAYVRMSDGTDFGKHMLKEGLCAHVAFKYPHVRAEEYDMQQEKIR